jgi:hypothetical protein
MIEMKRQTSLIKEDQNMRERENAMMRELYDKMVNEIDSRNKQVQLKIEDQERRGRELENVVHKVQKLEQEDLNRLKRVFHEKIISDKEKNERDEEKARVLFQEVARLGENMRREGRDDVEQRKNILKRIGQIESKVDEESKR